MGWHFPDAERRYCRVLYITGNSTDYILVSSLISTPDFQIDQAIDEQSGMARLQADRYNLVLLSWSMSGSSGINILRKLKSDTRLKVLPVILISDDAVPANLGEAYGAGASCVICLPGNLNRTTRLLQAIATFWSGFAQLPFCVRG